MHPGRALVVLLLACDSMPDRPSCHWGTADRFFGAAADGVCLDTDVTCTTWAARGRGARSASNGATTLRVWIDSDGAVQAEPGRSGACVGAHTVSGSSGATEVDVAWTGELYEVAWSQSDGTYVARVAEVDWQPRAPVRVADASQRLAWRAALGRRVLVRRRSDATPGAVRLYDDELNGRGAVDPGPGGALVDAALGGDRLAVVWGATDGAPAGALVYDLPGGLTAPVAPPVLQDAAIAEPHVAWTGSVFVAVWWAVADAAEVGGATLGADGQLVAGPVVLAADGMAPTLAATRDAVLMVYTVHDSASYCFGELRAAFIDANVLTAAAPVTLGSSGVSTLTDYAVVAAGDHFEVAAEAKSYVAGAGALLTNCASPMFVGVDGNGVGYTEVLARPDAL
jgi:hypothetical protein